MTAKQYGNGLHLVLRKKSQEFPAVAAEWDYKIGVFQIDPFQPIHSVKNVFQQVYAFNIER